MRTVRRDGGKALIVLFSVVLIRILMSFYLSFFFSFKRKIIFSNCVMFAISASRKMSKAAQSFDTVALFHV